jgi:hypothetical protein
VIEGTTRLNAAGRGIGCRGAGGQRWGLSDTTRSHRTAVSSVLFVWRARTQGAVGHHEQRRRVWRPGSQGHGGRLLGCVCVLLRCAVTSCVADPAWWPECLWLACGAFDSCTPSLMASPRLLCVLHRRSGPRPHQPTPAVSASVCACRDLTGQLSRLGSTDLHLHHTHQHAGRRWCTGCST